MHDRCVYDQVHPSPAEPPEVHFSVLDYEDGHWSLYSAEGGELDTATHPYTPRWSEEEFMH